MRYLVTLSYLLKLLVFWDYTFKYNLTLYQIPTNKIVYFVEKMHEHPVMEIKVGTPEDFIAEIRKNFEDYFVFF